VNGWLTGLGLSVNRTRLQLYRKVFDGVVRARISGTVEQFAEQFPPEVYSGCFSDVTTVQAIRTAFPKARSRAIRVVLKRGLEGVGLLRDEKPDGNKARDHLFQLRVASYFRYRGIPVLINRKNDGTRPDVIARIREFSFDVECKRVQSYRALASSVKEAMDQLDTADRRFARKARARRPLIVLDVSKLCFTGTTLLEFEKQRHYEAFVEYSVAKAALAIEKATARHPIPPRITVLLPLSIPAFVLERGCSLFGNPYSKSTRKSFRQCRSSQMKMLRNACAPRFSNRFVIAAAPHSGTRRNVGLQRVKASGPGSPISYIYWSYGKDPLVCPSTNISVRTATRISRSQ
jgi:hypothetical protein